MKAQAIKINNIKDLGVVLRQYRKEQGLSQERAAGLLGVSRKFLSEIETGRKNTIQLGKVLQILHRMGLGLQLLPREKR